MVGDEPEPESTARRNRRSSPRPLGPALLLVLDTLGPSERLAFVLHDLFGVPFEDIATIVDRSPAAGPSVGQPGPSPGAGRRRAAPRRRRAPATDRRGVPGRLPPRGLRDAGLPARPRRDPSGRPGGGEIRHRQSRSGRSSPGARSAGGSGGGGGACRGGPQPQRWRLSTVFPERFGLPAGAPVRCSPSASSATPSPRSRS